MMNDRYFYSHLAIYNIKKNSKIYIPYILTCILNVAMFYIVLSLSGNDKIDLMIGADTIRYFLQMGVVIIVLFSFIFLFYTNHFLMKRRTKEFALFHILGMEKRHVFKIIALESFYIGITSLVIGILIGMLLDKMMYLCIGKMFQTPVVLGFYVSFSTIVITILVFSFIFLTIYLKSRRQIKMFNPIELLKSSHAGEKEPKAKWLLALLGIVCLSLGYFIALTVKSPLTAFGLFFVAVILVIIGTYLLFCTGSIALLKLLKKNKRYYYRSQHFISISSMIYRMKQNAVGLANICVLCTMVLVMLSSTISMWVGIDDMIQTRYPRDMTISIENPNSQTEHQVEIICDDILKDKHVKKENELKYTYLSFAALHNQNTFSTDQSDVNVAAIGNVENLFFMTRYEYERVTGQKVDLKDNEIMLYTNRGSYVGDHLQIYDYDFQIIKKLNSFVGNGILASNIATSQFIVIKDDQILNDLDAKQKLAYGKNASSIRSYYGFDTNLTDKEDKELYNHFEQTLTRFEFNGRIECRAVEKDSFMGLYAGLLFLGVFLSVLFIMATVLIIYYKQISEGYEDKERFEIMQKVGMSQELVKKSIRSQVLTLFLLPPVIAGIHELFAFPFISKILEVFGLENLHLYAISSIICFIIFIIVYILIYSLTARSYYKIVKIS